MGLISLTLNCWWFVAALTSAKDIGLGLGLAWAFDLILLEIFVMWRSSSELSPEWQPLSSHQIVDEKLDNPDAGGPPEDCGNMSNLKWEQWKSHSAEFSSEYWP